MAEPFKTYQCGTCGFIYSEAEGLPEEGFPPGTRWADIPKDWVCPDCSMLNASQSSFWNHSDELRPPIGWKLIR